MISSHEFNHNRFDKTRRSLIKAVKNCTMIFPLFQEQWLRPANAIVAWMISFSKRPPLKSKNEQFGWAAHDSKKSCWNSSSLNSKAQKNSHASMKAHYFEFNLCNTFLLVFYICIWEEIFLRFTLCGTFFFLATKSSFECCRPFEVQDLGKYPACCKQRYNAFFSRRMGFS